MADLDPTKGGDNSGERLSTPSKEVARALGDIARLKTHYDELIRQSDDSDAEAGRLMAELERVNQEQRAFNIESHDVAAQYRNATLDTVEKLAEVVNTYELTVEEALELTKGTLANLDGKLLSDVSAHDPWGSREIPAVREIDYDGLAQKAQALRDLPAGEFIGLSGSSRTLFVAQPIGEPRLRLTANSGTGLLRGTDPFPYGAEIEVGIIRTEASNDDSPETFRGDIIVGSAAIVDKLLKGRWYDYLTYDGKPGPVEQILDHFRVDQEVLRAVAGHEELLNNVDREQRQRIEKAIDKSKAGFGAVIGQQAASVYGIESNKKAYTEILGTVYFDKKDYRKTTDLIDTIYGDGSNEARVKLAAYTQVLARYFEEDGELGDDVEVSMVDMRQAMYYLTLDKSQK